MRSLRFPVSAPALFLGFLFCNIIESVLQKEIMFYNNPPHIAKDKEKRKINLWVHLRCNASDLV